jgi:hypothetical protein
MSSPDDEQILTYFRCFDGLFLSTEIRLYYFAVTSTMRYGSYGIIRVNCRESFKSDLQNNEDREPSIPSLTLVSSHGDDIYPVHPSI